MPVTAQQTRFTFTGNGVATTFAYGCRILSAAHIEVQLAGVVQTSGYSVTGVNNPSGGTVVFAVAPANGAQIILQRVMPIERATDYQSNGDLLEATLDDDQDAQTMLLQQVDASVQRALRVPRSDAAALVDLPAAASRANLLLGFDSNGQPIATAPVAGSASALATQLASSAGAAGVGFLQSGTGAVARTAQDKMAERVSVFDFMTTAQIADVRAGTLLVNVATAFQAAINFCATNNRRLWVPEGDYRLDAGLTCSAGPLTIEGEESERTRLYIRANAPCISVTAQQVTLRSFAIIGEQNGAKTLQSGVYINNVNLARLIDLSFTQCFNSVRMNDVVFYTELVRCKFFDCVFAHIRTEGTASAGCAFQVLHCQGVPSQGQYCMYLENLGSLTMADTIWSPANVTEQCMRVVSRAVNAGVHLIKNVVFEGSVKEAVRLEGTVSLPINFFFFGNCYFNQSGAFDAVTLLHTQYTSFSNCYLSGTGAGVTFDTGINRGSKFNNCDFQINGALPVIRGISGSVLGLDIVAPTYNGAQRLLDLTALAAANVTGVNVIGGNVGNNGNPVQVPAAAAARVRQVGTLGNNRFEAGGVAQFNGGVSLFSIAHGLLTTPSVFQVVSNSLDAGNAEIREVTVDAVNINVQCKGSAAAGTNNVRWSWWARC